MSREEELNELPEGSEEVDYEEQPAEDELDLDSQEDEDESEEEESEEDSDEEEDSDGERPAKRRRRSKPVFVPPPPREMPTRTTRGNRMGKMVTDEGDEEFWNQEALKEEENDEVYETESEPDDVVDADFDEEEEEEASEDEEAEAAAREPKKKVLKPPGYKKPPLPPRPKPKVSPSAGEGGAAPKRKKAPSAEPAAPLPRRQVRESTRQRVEEGEAERKLMAMLKPRRQVRQHKPRATLTQAELLAEAANTEIENTRSLQFLQLLEEETKKKATADKKKYVGPMVRFQSRRRDGAELTTLEVRNMHTPPELQPRVAPPPVQQPLCVITGQPAKYRDLQTGLPYATIEAFRELQRRKELGIIPLPPPKHQQQQQQEEQWAQELAGGTRRQSALRQQQLQGIQLAPAAPAPAAQPVYG